MSLGKKRRIAVIGGGITGLATAYYLQAARRELDLPSEIDLYERDARLGGVIRTERRDGLLLDLGPEGWASYKPSTRRLLEQVGAENEIVGSRDEYRKTLLLRGGRLQELPDGMMFLAPIEPLAFWRSAPLSLAGKLRASLEPMVPRSRGDLSIREFFRRRLGTEFTENLVEPLVSGVVGPDYEKLSARSSLAELYRAEQRAGSLWRGLHRFAGRTGRLPALLTLRRGMETMVHALTDALADVNIRLQTPVRSLALRQGEVLVTGDDLQEAYDLVVLTTPASATAGMLTESLPEVAGEVRSVPYHPSILVFLAYRAADFSFETNLFGFVVSREEALLISACTWVSTKFAGRAPDEIVLLRCSVRQTGTSGSDEERLNSLSDEALAEQVHEELAKVLGLKSPPVSHYVHRRSEGLPSLFVGHEDRLTRVSRKLNTIAGVRLLGSYVTGVGIPDCILAARQCTEELVSNWIGRPWSAPAQRQRSA
ncbi:MAG TPA: protoporphyrinogen oxidase [Acidobacteriota bacterium]|nr:protoporphyrinogen oxidase [Acidobacteriota bacterium]